MCFCLAFCVVTKVKLPLTIKKFNAIINDDYVAVCAVVGCAALSSRKERIRIMREMDLRIFWGILLRNMKIIVVVAILMALAVGGATEVLSEDTYSSKCTMYVMNITKDAAGDTTGISSAGLDASQRMVGEYIQLLKSDLVLSDVQVRLLEKNYKMSISGIRSSLSMTAVEETALLRITATTGNPDLSKDICDALQECAPDHVREVMLGIGYVTPVDVAGRGTLRAPQTARNAVLGIILGFIISYAFAVLMYLMDNTVKDEKDLKARFEVNVLGVVPNFESMESHKTSGKKKSKKDKAAKNAKKGEN